MEKSIDRVLVIALTPLLLEKGLVWFQKNLRYINRAARAPLASNDPNRPNSHFWSRNSLVIERYQKLFLSEFTRKLSEFGYRKYQMVELPGEFSQLGGTITVFPINSLSALRIEFNGNLIEKITALGHIQNDRPETPLKKIIANKKEIQNDLSGLKEGDYVVHLDHGVGKFIKKEYISKDDYSQKEHIQNSDDRLTFVYSLEYAAGDKLIIPESAAYKLSPYIGFSSPTVYRLGGNLWHKTKRKVKEDIIKTARELLAIYAAREIARRAPYNYDEEILRQIESGFEFEETPDQKTAIAEILNDFRKSTPMDRILCGDVGFGKTESAIRAAAVAASAGRQTALIAPTTILAWQHFQTFLARFADLPINIALFSRIQKRTEQKQIAEKLTRGELDIIIGTHRLLQNDVRFKNLGLLIIDEEQRFGVKQKEKLKSMRANVDVLALSATPIPRTLYFALAGLKNISSIQTPPIGRLAIKTFIAPRSKKLIREAIAQELARGGQIYYLHNRIATIDAALLKLKKFIGSSARIAVAHAKLPENQLIETIENFRARQYDILLATTIIENGLDLSNVNTLIVEDASRLGLAQAHQLRGRIGRGDKQAYAYFLYRPKRLTEVGKRRLETLQKYQALGAGYEIARRDLEIRGAGNILGREQHGAINKVGLNLYCQMLNEAVEEMRSQSM